MFCRCRLSHTVSAEKEKYENFSRWKNHAILEVVFVAVCGSHYIVVYNKLCI
jgi:hypothetical protein